MKSIPDETPVSAVSIPGTHGSFSLHGGPAAKCQVWNLNRQLQVGLRYFDVHAGIWMSTPKHVYIWDSHRKISQQIQLEKVLKIIFFNFLEINSSETVLLKVEIHGIYKIKVIELMKKLILEFKDTIWTELSIPNMQQARGRIVFLHL